MPERTPDEFSCEPCAACNHANVFHRPNNGPCFAEPNCNALSRSDIDLENVQERKEMGAECWCRRYEIDLALGIDSILKNGDVAALVAATNAAVERGDSLSAKRLLDRYARKVYEHRDLEWVSATKCSIARLRRPKRRRNTETETLALPANDFLWCRNCLHQKAGHRDGKGPCLFTTDRQLPSELASSQFTLCPCEKFQGMTGTVMPANEVNIVVAGWRFPVSYPTLDKAKNMKVDGAVAGPELWRSLQNQFMALAAEEIKLRAEANNRGLRAYADYETAEHRSCGDWTLSEGPNENFRARFEAIATHAGVALGKPPQNATPLDFWLHSLFLDSLAHKSQQLFAAQRDEGGIVRRICEVSATYCARREKQALEQVAENGTRRLKLTAEEVAPTEKLDEPKRFPTMSVREVMSLLQTSRASVYRYLNEGRLERPGLNRRPGKKSKTLVLTTSVQKMLRPAEE